MYSILIRGGKVLSGTGSPWFHADVAVEEDRVKLLRGDTSRVEAARIIDATGLVVAPGFIDLHSHTSLLAFQEPDLEPKIRQGVTTEVVGVDGNSYAPFSSSADAHCFMQLNAGIEGRLSSASTWRSIAEYLDALDQKTSCNIACFVGGSTLRITAVGWENRRPTAEELQHMQQLLGQSLREGAWGLSTGLTYPPGCYADTDELVELCRVVWGEGGLHVSHLRYSLGDRFLDPLREAVTISQQSGVPLHVSHLNTLRPGGANQMLSVIDDARRQGVDVTFDSYPYPYSASRLVALLPTWAQEGGPGQIHARVGNRKERSRIASDPEFAGRDYRLYLVTNFSRRHLVGFEGWPLSSIAEALGKSVGDTLCDLLREELLDLAYVCLGGNPVNIRRFFQHPAHMVASDSLFVGRQLNPRSYGCFPFVLGDLCREEQVLGLPEAIRKMTSLPAQRLGLTDRGVLRDGNKADIVVFDPQQVRALATLEEPRRFPEGIAEVIVNGVIVLSEGAHTGAHPGRSLRRS